ncbi:MAG TPA: carbohydrate ABC transporter permease [Chloroflexota bacterium]|nr:carbohydrate ABC transporter permease [Chloroflexota bacterium]
MAIAPRVTRRGRSISVWAVLGILVALTYAPILVVLSVSVKDSAQFYNSFWGISLPFHWENFGNAGAVLAPYLLNSIIVSGSSMAGVVVLSCFAAYAFARFRFAGREVLYYMVLALMMIPGVLTLVPQFLLVKNLGLLETRWALILPYIASGQVLAIFIMRAFFAGLPEELFESARIDGAGELSAFWRIALPLTKPVLGTVAIIQLLATWNDYVWPFVVTQQTPDLYTLVVGLVSFTGRHSTDWGLLMAGNILAALPLVVVFLFAVRYFVQGLTAGALKV